jgi:hypothetical protein
LIFHINTLIVFENNFFIIWTMPFVLKSTKLFDVNFFINRSLMYMHSMNFKLICSFKCNKFFIKAIFLHTNVMRHFEMGLEIQIIFVVSIFLLWTTYITNNMLKIDMYSKFIIIEKVFFTKFTIWMQKYYISKLINITSL